MMDVYGKAIVEERLKPRHLAELAVYLRREYAPGTELGWLIGEANGALRQRNPPKANGGVLRAVVAALKGLVPGKASSR